MSFREALRDKESTTYQIFDLARFIIICLAIVVPVRIFVAQPFIVQGASMVPTIHNGEYFIVDRLSYRLDDPQRGDVVVLRPPHNPKTFYIKRIIGLPGETVTFNKSAVTISSELFEEDLTLDEPYISHPINDPLPPVALADGEYYVMGDNRPNSQDSRFFGPLEEERIIGRAWLRLFPLGQAEFHPGDFRDQYSSGGLEAHS